MSEDARHDVPFKILHSGYVKKQRVSGTSVVASLSGSLTRRRWKCRYLELHPTTLVWVRHHGAATESTSTGYIEGLHRRAASKGYILIDASTKILEIPPLLGHTGTIIVRCPAENRALSFRCSSVDEHREWFDQIAAVIKGAVQKSNSEAHIVRRLSGSFVTGADGKLSRLETFQSEQSSSKGMPFSSSDEGSDEGGDSINMASAASEARLLAIAGNSTCADCTTSDPVHYPNTPAWGSCNLGVLFCIRCAGIHRLMGVHVSKVLSIRIDTWSEEQLEAMEAKGNAAVNAQLEAEVRRNDGLYPLIRSVAASRSPDLPPKSMEEATLTLSTDPDLNLNA